MKPTGVDARVEDPGAHVDRDDHEHGDESVRAAADRGVAGVPRRSAGRGAGQAGERAQSARAAWRGRTVAAPGRRLAGGRRRVRPLRRAHDPVAGHHVQCAQPAVRGTGKVCSSKNVGNFVSSSALG